MTVSKEAVWIAKQLVSADLSGKDFVLIPHELILDPTDTDTIGIIGICDRWKSGALDC